MPARWLLLSLTKGGKFIYIGTDEETTAKLYPLHPLPVRYLPVFAGSFRRAKTGYRATHYRLPAVL